MNRRILLLGAGAALTTPALLRTAPAAAQAMPGSPGPAFQRMRVGSLEVTVVTDGANARNASNPGVVANARPEQVVAALRDAGFAGPEYLQPFNPTVVRTPRGLVVFDVGNAPGSSPGTGQFLANMRAAGLDPAEVTAVVLTHLHPDHFGGLLDASGAPNFPNARIFVGQREWAFWSDEGEESRARDQLKPIFGNARRRLAPMPARWSSSSPAPRWCPA